MITADKRVKLNQEANKLNIGFADILGEKYANRITLNCEIRDDTYQPEVILEDHAKLTEMRALTAL